MDYFELIHEYVDGTLEPAREQELFAGLSSNEDLRSEMKQQMTMKSAIKSDTRAFTPRPSSTVNIFNSLGFTAPVEEKPAESEPDKKESGRSQALISGIVSSLLTLIIVFLLLEFSGNSIINSLKGNKLFNNGDNIYGKALRNEIPYISSFDNSAIAYAGADKNEEAHVKTITKIKYVPVYINKENEIDNTKDLSLVDNTDNMALADAQKEIQVFKLQKTDIQNVNNIEPIGMRNPIPVINEVMNIPVEFSLPDKFSVELRGFQDWHATSPSVNPAEQMRFNNSSVAVFYSLTENIKAGLDYRRENFVQVFSGYDSEGNYVQYEQQPNFNSLNLIMRYENFADIYGVSPFIQAAYGFTNAGSIFRAMPGLKYSPYDGYSFILGLEYSDLFFRHTDARSNTIKNSSDKIGITYGIGIDF